MYQIPGLPTQMIQASLDKPIMLIVDNVFDSKQQPQSVQITLEKTRGYMKVDFAGPDRPRQARHTLKGLSIGVNGQLIIHTSALEEWEGPRS